MKNLFKLFAVVLVAAFLLVSVSCGDGDVKKGGTIEVINALNDGTVSILVIVVKGKEVTQALEDLGKGKGVTQIPTGSSKKFTFNEDGFYTVVSSSGGLPQTVWLALGVEQKVTIK